jgi:hypothetical protein
VSDSPEENVPVTSELNAEALVGSPGMDVDNRFYHHPRTPVFVNNY